MVQRFSCSVERKKWKREYFTEYGFCHEVCICHLMIPYLFSELKRTCQALEFLFSSVSLMARTIVNQNVVELKEYEL